MKSGPTLVDVPEPLKQFINEHYVNGCPICQSSLFIPRATLRRHEYIASPFCNLKPEHFGADISSIAGEDIELTFECISFEHELNLFFISKNYNLSYGLAEIYIDKNYTNLIHINHGTDSFNFLQFDATLFAQKIEMLLAFK